MVRVIGKTSCFCDIQQASSRLKGGSKSLRPFIIDGLLAAGVEVSTEAVAPVGVWCC
jgi:hypothetical protein